MAFDSLQDRLTKTLRSIQGKAKLSDRNIEETLNEIRVALLDSDVNYKVVQNFLGNIKEKAIGQDVLNTVDPGQMLVKIVNDELVTLLGNDDNQINFNESGLTTIMVVGLQGTGKTTQVAKIANNFKKLGKKVLLVAGDVVRPAAIEQLKTLALSIDVEVFSKGLFVNALNTSKEALTYAKNNNFDVMIIDTAGRLQIDEALMNELVDIKDAVKPNEILLIVDALTGQDIVNVASTFNGVLNITGLIVTKFDGDSKGGAVLSVKSITNVPIKFVGNGEKINDLEEFHPDRLANRILGMGDVVTLVEKAQEEFDEKEAEKVMNRMMNGKFSLDDMLYSIEKSRKLGPISSLMNMMPGMADYKNMVNDDDADKALKKTKAIIQSMTPEERKDPSMLRGTHKRRIASGSGTTVDDVNKLINQFDRTKKLMKQLGSMKGMFNL